MSTTRPFRALRGAHYLLACGAAAGLGLTVAAQLQTAHGGSSLGPSPLADASCIEAAAPSTFTGATLDSNTPKRDGVVFNAKSSQLQLQKSAGNFAATTLPVTDSFLFSCAGDFDEDGWTDFIGAGQAGSAEIKFYRNRTFDNAPPSNWSDPTRIRQPKFVSTLVEANRGDDYNYVVCGDFNGDRHQDFAIVSGTGTCPDGSAIYPDSYPCPGTIPRASLYLGRGNGSFQAAYQFVTNLSTLSTIWGQGAVSFDYNKDGRMDLVVGTTDSSASGGVNVLLNDGRAQPKFDTVVPILKDAHLGAWGAGALAVDDFTGDSVPDLIVSGVSSAELRLYPGRLGGGFDPTFQSIPWVGGADLILSGDFSLDGKADFVVGTDNWNYPGTTHQGGKGYFYKNNGTVQPFSGGATNQYSEHQEPHDGGRLFDFDGGTALDYDHDPDRTLDFMMNDGNHSGAFFMFANRPMAGAFVQCGTVASGTLDIGGLANQSITVTAVEIGPTVQTDTGTSVKWEASNDGGLTWVPATACASNAQHFCTTFDRSVGREVQWRATMCSDGARTKTPVISAINLGFAYTKTQNHMRAGPVASEGLIYAGAFSEPGHAGHFYAINDQSSAIAWDSAPLLTQATDASRKIYTAGSRGERISFGVSSSSDPSFRAALLAASADAASAIVTWQRSARFGLSTRQPLGSIESSTAAIMTPPHEPYWYTFPTTTAAEKAAVDAYKTAYANRPRLALVGSKDGALHAFRTDPTRMSDPANGTEAWAYIPPDIAARLAGDMTSGTLSAYPDGSPTLVNAKINGLWKTVLISGEGNGGTSVYALDVTDSISDTGAISGPKPLWSYTDLGMGATQSKPTVVRVKLAGSERWLAVFASGPGATPSAGHTVYALDVTTGQLVWKFDTLDNGSYITTDVSAAETSDAAEAGSPQLDGYIDRLYFGDSKGRIWKLDPAGTGALVNEPARPGLDVGLTAKPLFSTRATARGLGVDRAIMGNIAVAQDGSGHLVLYFGTGTPDSSTPNEQNAFYAVYSHSGEVRSVLNSATDLPPGMKFSGGVVINDDQVIFGIGRDLGSTGLCAPTEGQIVGVDINSFTRQFTINTGSKIVSPIFVRNGQYYVSNFKGEIQTSAYTAAASAGATPGVSSTTSSATTAAKGASSSATASNSAAGSGTDAAAASSNGTTPHPFSIVSWVQRN